MNNNQDIEKIVGDYKYGFKTDVENVFDTGRGISEDVVRLISKMKNEPEWMLDIRLKAYHEFAKMKWPTFGPDLSSVTFDEYTNISQTFNSLFFFDNVWEERIEYLIPLGAANRTGRKLQSVEFIVCHDTANNNAGAYGHAGYITSSAAGSTSWHYSCGSDDKFHHYHSYNASL